MRDLRNNIGIVQLRTPLAVTDHTDFATDWIPTAGFQGVVLVAQFGAQAGEDGSNYVIPKVQESDTTAAGDAVTVTDTKDITNQYTATMLNASTGNYEQDPAVSPLGVAATDNSMQAFGYTGDKKYVRLLFDFTGTAVSSVVIGAIAILGIADKKPVVPPTPVAAT